MLSVHVFEQGRLHAVQCTPESLPDGVLWVDLLRPTEAEEALVESSLALNVPTHEEMVEIEVSSRLYSEGDAVFMTAVLLAHADTDRPALCPVTFILTPRALLTVRYAEPRTFDTFAQHLRSDGSGASALLIGLLDAIVDRAADVLERIGAGVEGLSQQVFATEGKRASRDLRAIMGRIGYEGGLTSNQRESLVSLGRLLGYLMQVASTRKSERDIRGRIKTLARDVGSLTDQASFLSGKITFLLDATLGMINIEQTNIIKMFSVAAVVFLPPTLIASIYGMNFAHMPELGWPLGYPLSLLLMVVSGLVPLSFFKRKGWV